jgi:hypothetical protein
MVVVVVVLLGFRAPQVAITTPGCGVVFHHHHAPSIAA